LFYWHQNRPDRTPELVWVRVPVPVQEQAVVVRAAPVWVVQAAAVAVEAVARVLRKASVSEPLKIFP
jgi:hypothetical protein